MRLVDGITSVEVLQAMLKKVTQVAPREFACHCGCNSSLTVAVDFDVIWVASCVPDTGMFAMVGVTSYKEAGNMLRGIKMRQALTGKFNEPTQKMWDELAAYVLNAAQKIDPQPTQPQGEG